MERAAEWVDEKVLFAIPETRVKRQLPYLEQTNEIEMSTKNNSWNRERRQSERSASGKEILVASRNWLNRLSPG